MSHDETPLYRISMRLVLAPAAPHVAVPWAVASRALPPIASILVRIAEESDLTQLAELTTSALYGEVELFKDGPVMALQRQQILQQQRRTLTRRLGFEGEAQCRFFVAVEPSEFGDRICGSLDLAVHLFRKNELHFELERNTMPEGSEALYRWSPYMASVAVSKADRRAGVGRKLVQTAEAWALQNGYKEMMLEVSECNESGIQFYERIGYGILSSFAAGEAGGGGEVVTREGVRWEVQQTGKHVMRKQLGNTAWGGSLLLRT